MKYSTQWELSLPMAALEVVVESRDAPGRDCTQHRKFHYRELAPSSVVDPKLERSMVGAVELLQATK